MTITYYIEWHTRPAVGLTYHSGADTVTVNYDPHFQSAQSAAGNRLINDKKRVFPGHEIVVDSMQEVYQ